MSIIDTDLFRGRSSRFSEHRTPKLAYANPFHAAGAWSIINGAAQRHFAWWLVCQRLRCSFDWAFARPLCRRTCIRLSHVAALQCSQYCCELVTPPPTEANECNVARVEHSRTYNHGKGSTAARSAATTKTSPTDGRHRGVSSQWHELVYAGLKRPWTLTRAVDERSTCNIYYQWLGLPLSGNSLPGYPAV